MRVVDVGGDRSHMSGNEADESERHDSPASLARPISRNNLRLEV